MTGVGYRVAVDGQDKLERDLALLESRLGDLTPLMNIFGQTIETDIEDNFEGEHGPDGVPWTPSQRVIQHGGKTLSLSRRLRMSISRLVGRNFVEVGTNLVYAARNHFGFKGTEFVSSYKRVMRHVFGVRLAEPMEVMVGAHSRQANTPARPFVGISTDAREEMEAQAADYLGAQP